jgi:hypothetical protein
VSFQTKPIIFRLRVSNTETRTKQKILINI